MREFTATAGLDAAKKVLESAESALGQFLDRTKDSTSIQNAVGASGGGISDALTDFFNQWESFSVKPNDVGEKQLLIAKAQILAEKINATDKNLKQVQTDADNQLSTDVGTVNGILAEIAKTNEYIAKAELVKPNSAVDLRDQRQAKLEELSKYIDVTFETGELGQITVKSGDNTLIEGKVVTGQTTNTTTGQITGPFSYDATAQKIKLGSNNFTSGGKLGGQLDASTKTVQKTRDQINGLAVKLKGEVNTAYGDDFFTLSPTGPLNLQFNSTITLSAGDSGGNTRALNVAELGTKIYNDTDFKGSFSANFNTTVTELAQKLNTTNTRLEDQKLSEDMAVSNRDSFSGVSQDEEMTDLMKFQRSFQANSRFINVVDNLLDQVVNHLGSF
jgi:flagellar hook-associated protein 1 FlgK